MRLLTLVGIRRPQLVPLSVPTGLAAVANGASEIDLTWAAVPGATGYRVERSADGVTGWSVVASPLVSSYSDLGLNPGTTYYYRVKSYIPEADSAPGPNANATTTGGSFGLDFSQATNSGYLVLI